ncbi:MAG: thioredoxin-dependent thiol peroxidase [Rhodospirillaceae bacterium]|nr:thioredoxin-dependent thiol peroxidase [Rhodospirillaceae bacterium]|tara:strand:- start:1772 stop:2242 length:471 start_codon:yes stop_codon:yes gene_type:complete
MTSLLNEGDKAPVFTAMSDGDRSLNSNELRGKVVVLFFYPKDDTPGCTKESCGFSDLVNEFKMHNAVIIGVSKDSIDRHNRFKEKYNLKFDLISDEEGSLCESFGTWKEKKNYGRTYMGIERSTFIIDEEGKIIKIWRKVRVNGHVEEVLDFIKGI